MSVDRYIKRNDTTNALQATLQDADGVAVNLTGATVKFKMRLASSRVTKVDASATIVTAASGIVKYTWQTGDTDTAGNYEGEFEVTYTDNTIQTFPNDSYIKIQIKEDVS